MLYQIYEDMTSENLVKMKFLLNGKLSRIQTETSKVRTHTHLATTLEITFLHPQLHNKLLNMLLNM